MSESIQQAAMAVLSQVSDPLTQESLSHLGAIPEVVLVDQALVIDVCLGYPGEEQARQLREQLQSEMVKCGIVDHVKINVHWQAPTRLNENRKPVPGVRNIIAVASGKGGVGKSTTTVNLALALSQLGAKVGVLDADIYGPSLPHMLGVSDKRPEVRDQKAMLPVMAYGIQSMSMGYLLSEKTPAVWRGPMATGALQQLIFQTDWDDLDYLFVDMPPGTGDIQLTLSQQVPVSGAIVVTTPQDIALLDAKKAIEMFAKVNIPILGVVENMAVHQCSQCGHSEHIFGEGGGERIAKDYQSQLLGALPLSLQIRQEVDSGKPTVAVEPDGNIAAIYRTAAQRAAANLWLQSLTPSQSPQIIVSED